MSIEPEIVEYLKTPPGRQRLEEIVRLTGEPVRNLLRERGTPYAELGLGDAKWSDEELISFMVAHPVLMNRPVVVGPKGAVLARPVERALEVI